MSNDVAELETQLVEVNNQIREKYLDTLREGKADVVFTKADGELRTMLCTLNGELIPSDMMPKTDGNVTKANEAVVKVFDLDKQAWRSFRMDSVKSFAPKV